MHKYQQSNNTWISLEIYCYSSHMPCFSVLLILFISEVLTASRERCNLLTMRLTDPKLWTASGCRVYPWDRCNGGKRSLEQTRLLVEQDGSKDSGRTWKRTPHYTQVPRKQVPIQSKLWREPMEHGWSIALHSLKPKRLVESSRYGKQGQKETRNR